MSPSKSALWDPYADFKSTTLPNGLTVYAAQWPERPWEAIGMLVHSGAEHDPVGSEGVAHFVEHLVSGNAPISKQALLEFFDEHGGTVDLGMTGYPHTSYQFFLPIAGTALPKALSLFGHMLLTATLEQYIERERQIIIGEFHRRFPTQVDYELVLREQRAVYQGYWPERFVAPLGCPETIRAITAEQLQTFYDTHYTPANMSIVGVGGLNLTDLVALLSDSPFASEKRGTRTLLPTPLNSFLPPVETRHVFEISKYVNSAIETGAYRSTAKIPGTFNGRAVWIVRQMLAEKLNEVIREKNAWAYHIECSRYNVRLFYEFSIDCRGLSVAALELIEEVVNECINSLSSDHALLKRVKEAALASTLMIDPTGRGICEGAVEDLSITQRIITLGENRLDFHKIEMADIQQIVEWLRPEMRWTLITQP